MKELIAFFSRRDENYVSGRLKNLEIGNTERVAGILQKITGANIFQIEPLKPYAKDYNTCIEKAREEQRKDARPELKAYPESLEPYERVYLLYPNYWNTMPMPVFTFLERFDFKGKVICPLCTHEGSGMGQSEKDIADLCPGAVVEKGLAILGSSADRSEPELARWLETRKQ